MELWPREPLQGFGGIRDRPVRLFLPVDICLQSQNRDPDRGGCARERGNHAEAGFFGTDAGQIEHTLQITEDPAQLGERLLPDVGNIADLFFGFFGGRLRYGFLSLGLLLGRNLGRFFGVFIGLFEAVNHLPRFGGGYALYLFKAVY